jgi:hypothetical protein
MLKPVHVLHHSIRSLDSRILSVAIMLLLLLLLDMRVIGQQRQVSSLDMIQLLLFRLLYPEQAHHRAAVLPQCTHQIGLGYLHLCLILTVGGVVVVQLL